MESPLHPAEQTTAKQVVMKDSSQFNLCVHKENMKTYTKLKGTKRKSKLLNTFIPSRVQIGHRTSFCFTDVTLTEMVSHLTCSRMSVALNVSR